MPARGKTSLLIVDDDAPIRKLLERIALRAGFDADCAKDGIDALEMMQKKQYAIAIIDLMMPRLSGYELVQRISTMSPRPVILVATAMTNADVSKIDDTLVRRVIKKPFDMKSVADTLIETARSIADQSPMAPPDAVIHVSAEQLSREIEDETAQQRKESGEEEPPTKQPSR